MTEERLNNNQCQLGNPAATRFFAPVLHCLKHLQKLDKDKPMKMKGKKWNNESFFRCVSATVFEHMSLKKSERVKRLHVLVRKQAKRPFQLSTKNTIDRCDVQTTTDNPFYFIFNSGSTFYFQNSITLYDYSMRLGVEGSPSELPPGWLMRIEVWKGEDASLIPDSDVRIGRKHQNFEIVVNYYEKFDHVCFKLRRLRSRRLIKLLIQVPNLISLCHF